MIKLWKINNVNSTREKAVVCLCVIIYCCTQETEKADGDYMEVALEGETSADHINLVHGLESPGGLSIHGEANKLDAAEEEMESLDTELAETEAAVVTAPITLSPLILSPSELSTGETLNTVLVPGGEPGNTSEAGKEDSEVKTEEQFQLNKEHYVETGKSLDQSAAGSDLSENTNTDTASDCKQKINTEDEMEDSDSKEAIKTRQQEDSHDSNELRVSAADEDLNEMMDIGTVDQMEQEAQMKEEECNTLDEESSCSPALSNAG